MRTFVAVGIGILCLAAALLFLGFLWFTPRSGGPVPTTAEHEPSQPGAPAALVGVERNDPSAPAAVALAPLTEAAERSPVAPVPVVPRSAGKPLAVVLGRLLLPSGAPAAGVAFELRGWQANAERVLRHGEPKDWKNLEATSGPDGSFRIEFDPPRAFQFALRGKLEGCVSVGWRWSEVEPGSTVDLGEIALHAGGSIAGSVVDEQGRPAAGGWQVYADSLVRASDPGGEKARVSAAADRATGEFRLIGLPAGRATLSANSRVANWIDGPAVDVVPGEEVRADIVYKGPDNSRRVSIVAFNKLFHVYNDVEDGHMRLYGGSGAPRVAHKIQGSSQSYSFDDVEPGSYTVEIDDPRFAPWRRENVETGQSVDAKLEGSAVAILRVVDPADGREIEDYELRVRFHEARFQPNEFVVRKPGQPRPSEGRFTGLMPETQMLQVRVEGFAPCEIKLVDLAPGEARPVEARLSRGSRLSGRVLCSGGDTPVPDIRVWLDPLVAGSQPQEDLDDRVQGRIECLTDGDGSFEFPPQSAGRYRLSAILNRLVRADVEPLELDGATAAEKDVELPGIGAIAGTLVGPPRVDWKGMRIVAWPLREGQPRRASLFDERFGEGLKTPRVEPDAAGRFLLDGLPAGPMALELELPSSEVQGGLFGASSTTFVSGDHIELERVEVPAEGTLERWFDLRERFPGFARVCVRVDGRAAAGLTVQAAPPLAQESARFSSSFATSDSGAAGQTGADGCCRLGPLRVGPVRLSVRSADQSVCYEPLELCTIPPAGEALVNLDIRLAEGELRVFDRDSGVPLANHRVYLRLASGTVFQRELDEQGVLRARLPLGRYELCDAGPAQGFWFPPLGPDSRVAFEWTPGGPLPSEVRVPAAKALELPKKP